MIFAVGDSLTSAVWNLWIVLFSILNNIVLYSLHVNNFMCQVIKNIRTHSVQGQEPIVE